MTLIGIIALAGIGWSIAATLVFALMFAARTREELERTLSATLALLEETDAGWADASEMREVCELTGNHPTDWVPVLRKDTATSIISTLKEATDGALRG